MLTAAICQKLRFLSIRRTVSFGDAPGKLRALNKGGEADADPM
jgi:hypothetical protein